jgi:hypothetical protein
MKGKDFIFCYRKSQVLFGTFRCASRLATATNLLREVVTTYHHSLAREKQVLRSKWLKSFLISSCFNGYILRVLCEFHFPRGGGSTGSHTFTCGCWKRQSSCVQAVRDACRSIISIICVCGTRCVDGSCPLSQLLLLEGSCVGGGGRDKIMTKKRKARSVVKVIVPPQGGGHHHGNNNHHHHHHHHHHHALEVVQVDADDWEIVKEIYRHTMMYPGAALDCSGNNGSAAMDCSGNMEHELTRKMLEAVEIEQTAERRITRLQLRGTGEVAQQDEDQRRQYLPPYASLDALKFLKIGNGYELPVLGVGDLTEVEEMEFWSVSTDSLRDILRFTPPRTRPLPKLKSLELRFTIDLTSIPEEIGLLGPSLERLKTDLTAIINEQFDVTGKARMLHVFPSSMRHLVKLREIDFRAGPQREVVSLDTASVFSHWRNLEKIQTNVYGINLMFPSPEDTNSLFKPSSCWPLLKEANVCLADCGLNLELYASNVSSAFQRLAAWTTLHTLVLDSFEPVPYYLPLHILRPLASNLKKLCLVPFGRPRFIGTMLFNMALEDVQGLHNLEQIEIRGARFVASEQDCTDDDDDDDKISTPSWSSVASLTRLELVDCQGFFSKESGAALDCLSSNRINLSKLQVLRLSGANCELGDTEFAALCTKIFPQCPQLREVDLSHGNIQNLNVIVGDVITAERGKVTMPGELVTSSLPRNTLRVLKLSGNPALSMQDGTPEEKEANIRALWSFVAAFPYLGYVGTFNMLFLGRLGEDYGRLGEYYRIIHHLALNRARSRVLMGQRVPRSLWPYILQKAQRAFDDYPGYVIAPNRKEMPDAIFHLLRERGAQDIFNTF